MRLVEIAIAFDATDYGGTMCLLRPPGRFVLAAVQAFQDYLMEQLAPMAAPAGSGLAAAGGNTVFPG